MSKPKTGTEKPIPMVQCPKCKREYPYIMLLGHGFSGLCFDCWRRDNLQKEISNMFFSGLCQCLIITFIFGIGLLIGYETGCKE